MSFTVLSHRKSGPGEKLTNVTVHLDLVTQPGIRMVEEDAPSRSRPVWSFIVSHSEKEKKKKPKLLSFLVRQMYLSNIWHLEEIIH